MSITNIVVNDPEMLAQLAAAEGSILFRGPNGECIRWVEPVPRSQLPERFRSLSDEEFEQARKRSDSGITLDEFWRRVERGEWK
jgi:hypothetical protein